MGYFFLDPTSPGRFSISQISFAFFCICRNPWARVYELHLLEMIVTRIENT